MESPKLETNEKNETRCCSFFQNGSIPTSLTILLILLATFLFAETIKSFKEYRYVGGGVAPSNIISVAGEGEVFAVPDTAEFVFSVNEEAETAAEVQAIATEKANVVIKALREKEIAEEDIKTINYSLSPKYEWKVGAVCNQFSCPRNQEQVGFTLNQSVRVKVRNLDRAGELLELVTEKGVSNVSGLTFTVADEDGLKEDARKLAIDEARAKAEKLASDLGVSLVRIVGFSESGDYGIPMYARTVESSYADGLGGGVTNESVSVPAGENKVTSNVSITYEIR